MQECPNCKEKLERSSAQAKADYCPKCGTWMDQEKSASQDEQRRGMKDSSRSPNRPAPPDADDAQVRKNM